jgi:hypothetical protein
LAFADNSSVSADYHQNPASKVPDSGLSRPSGSGLLAQITRTCDH